MLNAKEYRSSVRAFVLVAIPSSVSTCHDVFTLDSATVAIILGPFVMGMGMVWVYNCGPMRTIYPLVLLYGRCVYSCSVLNLENFLFWSPVLIFVGTVVPLRPLVWADTRSGALISRA